MASSSRLENSSEASESKKRLLFLDIGNDRFSQMAEAFAKQHVGKESEIWSAGSHPAQSVDPKVVTVMKEKGLDLTTAKPKATGEIPQMAWDAVISIACRAQCPTAVALYREDWDLSRLTEADLPALRKIRDDLEEKVQKLIRRYK